MLCFFCNSQSKDLSTFESLHDFKADMINGEILDFSSLKGKKLLIVNTASYCGLTSQYKDLEFICRNILKSSKKKDGAESVSHLILILLYYIYPIKFISPFIPPN